MTAPAVTYFSPYLFFAIKFRGSVPEIHGVPFGAISRWTDYGVVDEMVGGKGFEPLPSACKSRGGRPCLAIQPLERFQVALRLQLLAVRRKTVTI